MFCREEILAFVEVCFRNFGDRVKQFWCQLQFPLQEWRCGCGTSQIWWLSGRCASSPFPAKSSMSNQIVSASWFLSLFVLPLVFYVLVVLFPLFDLYFELHCDFGLWLVVVSDTVASGRTAYVTFKDPKALEIALHLSVWIQIMMGDIQLLRWAQTQFLQQQGGLDYL